ncbi:hypothetical protein PTSG_11725 [Salpingoeca rosetta]|uniref:RNA helicase n=1 Tax=Salpingoeca rosetta (strain ATCC 50818 / BSB-021) TaxID=946362 RepID=F2U096_SALR5|nr:uncharacterized protein PTSG_11725 [Salpingoeca rosetta]EGD80824.1 hypothetical protein PTSG_11725 [Salpingoeca rosetta]|eukprot:XP_004997385.1 hypothetical protein PTSG_11725 [Salpingoeca rosetta]
MADDEQHEGYATFEDTDDSKPSKRSKSKNKNKNKSGGFQSMGLSRGVFRGIMDKGYKVPTPIQRKTIPLIIGGQDVVGMARTGSGKTAAFVIPMLEKLKSHSAKVGIRALVMSPTRELAEQTFKFIKELGRRTDLRVALILGGDNMDDQFGWMHANPDVIVATPGRFLHLLVEMELSLKAVEYVVFDEADQLFEKGFEEHLKEILMRLPEDRQTLLFSATLPKKLIEFARAGLKQPTLVRLDADTKLSEQLRTQYVHCRRADKPAGLIYLLTNVIPRGKLTVVFVSTKHLIEYLKVLLEALQIPCTYSYGNLDPTARKINIAKFRAGKVKLLLVTDVAARGIDIPMLDYVVNYDFPRRPKLFVHRVGRVARAGRSGTAYSLVAVDEVAHLIDLHTFLGRPFAAAISTTPADQDGVFGRFPQALIDEYRELVHTTHRTHSDLDSLFHVVENGYKQYDKSRPDPAQASVKRAKQLEEVGYHVHPMLRDTSSDAIARDDFIKSIRNFRPSLTVFEVNKHANDSLLTMMTKKRAKDQSYVWDRTERMKELLGAKSLTSHTREAQLEASTSEEITSAFSNIIAPGRNKAGLLPGTAGATVLGTAQPSSSSSSSSSSSKSVMSHGQRVTVSHSSSAGDAGEDAEVYIPYRRGDDEDEQGYAINNGASFTREAESATFALDGDDIQDMHKSSQRKKWDRKKKKFVGESNNTKMIRTESGNKVPATFKSNRYKEWSAKNHVSMQHVGEEEDSQTVSKFEIRRKRRGWHTKTADDELKAKAAKRGGELKHKSQIIKERKRKQKLQDQMKRRAQVNAVRKGKKAKGKK